MNISSKGLISGKRLIALSLSLILFTGLLASCKKAKTQGKDPYADAHHNLNTPRIIKEEDEWWDSIEFSLASEGLSFDITSPDVQVQSKVLTVTDSALYVCFIGNAYADGAFSETIYTIAGFSIASGNEGKLLGEIDLNALVPSEYGYMNDICGTYEENGLTKLVFDVMNGDDLESYICDIDLAKGSIHDLKKLEFPVDTGKNYVTVNAIVFQNDTAFLKCSVHGKMGGSSTPCVFTLKGDDLSQVRLENIEHVGDFAKYDDNTIIMSVITAGKEKYLLLDTKTMAIKETEESRGEIYSTRTGIVSSDVAAKEEKVLLDFNHTYVSYNVYDRCEILSVDNDRIAIASNNVSTENTVVVLERADRNPNAGKQIIEAAHLEPLTEMEAEGICRFNRTNSKYFVINNEEYNYWDVFDWDAAEKNYVAERNRARAEKINALMSVISNGEGPDVILGASEFREIQNSLYLVDIASRIKDQNLSSEQYFTKIIEATDRDGRKYVLPYGASLYGIILNSKDADKSDTGIKIKNYKSFVDDVCNGNDPMYCYSDRVNYFNELIGSSFDLFEKPDGTISFDNDAFREMAEYVYQNVPEKINYNEGIVRITDIGSVQGAFIQYGAALKNKKLIGIPSPDGRGICCKFASSASITACSSCPDGAWEFMVSMLDEEVLRFDYGISINRKIFQESAITPEGAEIPQEIVDVVSAFIDECAYYYSTDYTISGIIAEEMPAYFAGQKSLDEVIRIIDSRVGTLMAERA